jgi:hypothetical protein
MRCRDEKRMPGGAYKQHIVGILLSILLSSWPQSALAQRHVEVAPSLSLRQVYDDNIDLVSENEDSDYITTLSPGINVKLLEEKRNLSFSYAPTFVRYAKESDNDTVRHSGTLTYAQRLTQYLDFDLSNTYLRSEEPLEETEGVEGVRKSRNVYQRNVGRIGLQYSFGPENSLGLGYSHSYLKNDDETVDDGREQHASVELAYWFDKRNGLNLRSGMTRADFWRDTGVGAGDDYTGHTAGLSYNRRFTVHTSGFVGYDLTTRDFDGVEEDYDVHQGTVGLEHAFSPDMTFTLSAGLFSRDNDQSDSDSGYSYDISFTRRFERGGLVLGGRGGWDEAYLEAERLGFSRYWSGNVSLNCQLLENLSGYVMAFYRMDEGDDNREWRVLRGSCGLSWEFLRWFSLLLDYSYAERDDDVNSEDYNVNRVMVTVTVSRFWKW